MRRVRAVDAGREGDGFRVVTDDGGELRCRRVVVATGVVDRFPQLEGFDGHYGTSAFHCPSCDGYESHGLAIAAYGWDEEVAGFAVGLLEWASDVVVLTDGRRSDGDDRHLAALADRGSGSCASQRWPWSASRATCGRSACATARRSPASGCSSPSTTSTRATSPTGSAASGPTTTAWSSTVTGSPLDLDSPRAQRPVRPVGESRSTVPGVYAAGDITPGTQLVQVAAGKGAAAGVACAMSLIDLGVPS